MIFKLGNRKALETQSSCIFPVEVHQCILAKCIDDPRWTFQELLALRFVSRDFNEFIASKSISSICLFQGSNVWTSLCQLETMLSSKQTPYSKSVKTLRIPDWYWTHGSMDHFVQWNEMPILSGFILMNTVLAFAYLGKPIFVPRTIPKYALRSFARLRLGAPFRPRLNLPEVKKFIWNVCKEPDWIFASTVRMLQKLPQLDELDLTVEEEMPNLYSFIYYLRKLTNLRKLAISLRYYPPGKARPVRSWTINQIGRVFKTNPNLTHLRLEQLSRGENIDLGLMFRFIPKDRPLKLEHIEICNTFYGAEAIIPHIRTLKSFHFCSSEYVRKLLEAEIFPPVMSFGFVDDGTVEYLRGHSQITSLSFPYHGSVGPEIFEIMARNSETLTEYGAAGDYLWCIGKDGYRDPFLRCTNLQRVVHHDKIRLVPIYEPVDVTPDMAATLSVISLLPKSLNMVFADCFGTFQGCLKYCREFNTIPSTIIASMQLSSAPKIT